VIDDVVRCSTNVFYNQYKDGLLMTQAVSCTAADDAAADNDGSFDYVRIVVAD